MTNTKNRVISLLLVFLQIALLLTTAVPQTRAVEDAAAQSNEQPVLNKTIRGTVQFSSFNYPGGNTKTGKEGADYVMPFIYTDDYFAKPSYNAAAPKAKVQNWSALEEKSLAVASLDFALSCFGTNESKLSQNYDDYAKNGLEFLRKCEFSDNVLVNNEFCAFPQQDSIGVIIGSKDINVWNNEQQKNEACKLIAIGIRGGGYGAEWASNLTLGGSGVHNGFRTAANKVELALSNYRDSLDLSRDAKVKYWVVGYSRSGAVANLVAGDISRNASSYQTTMEDVYGYTFESAAGTSMVASGNEPMDANDAATLYPNIHNMINKMDAVPRVSIREFSHNRLGVDYLLPYYGNTPEDGVLNNAYYRRMYSILNTIALGYYDDNSAWEPDPAVVNANPNSYPVNGTIQVQTFGFDKLLSDTSSFGASPYTGRWGNQTAGTDIGVRNPADGNYYMQLDQYLDQLVQMLFGSKAWDFDASKLKAGWENLGATRTYTYDQNNIINTGFSTHRTKYASKQSGQQMSDQDAMRYLIGKVFEIPGAKLTDMFGNITDNLLEKLIPAATLMSAVTGPFGDGYDDVPDENHASVVDSHFRDLLLRVLADLDAFKSTTNRYVYSPAGSLRFSPNTTYNVNQTTGNAVATLCPILTRLFLYDRNNYGSQYMGTLLKYAVSTILVTHAPEITTSWVRAMDENYTSDYRKITLPLNTDIKMYEFRGDYFKNENLDFDANANVVAEFKNGEKIRNLDGRIDWETGSDTITIWYPGNLDIRFDVKALAPVTVRSGNAALSDYEPAVDSSNVQGTNLKVADYTSDRKANGNVPDQVDLTRSLKSYTSNVQSANDVNDFLIRSSIPLEAGETLQILAKAGSNSLDNSFDAEYTIRKSAVKVVAFGKNQTVATNVANMGTVTGSGGTFAMSGSNLTFTPSVSGTDYSAFTTLTSSTYRFANDQKSITAQSKVDVIPATNIYYDDPAVGALDNPEKTTTLVSTIVNGKVDQTSTRDIKFYGTGIDAYCICDSSAGYVKAELLNADGIAMDGVTAKVMNNNYTGTLYNVPSIHFDVPGKDAGAYILRLSASFGKSYKLDGVRVFNESPEEAVEAKLAQIDEAEANYLNVREMLLGTTDPALNSVQYSTGVAYFTGDTEKTEFADYESIGPKRELYLTAAGQGIAFNVAEPDSVKVEIGLRAADNGTGSVKINGVSRSVTGIDTYYPVSVPQSGDVSIIHESGTVALTYIKLTAITDAVPAQTEGVLGAVGPQRIRASAKLLAFVNAPAAEPTEDPEPIVTPQPDPAPTPTAAPEPTPTPTPTPTGQDISSFVELFVSRLLQSISRLFGGW